MKVKGSYQITNSGDTAEIEFIGSIGWWNVSSDRFRQQMKELKAKGVTNLKAYINSGGGSLFDANEIVNELKAFPGRSYAKLGAIAASAATVIANAFNEVEGSSNTQYMIHNPVIDPGSVDEKGLESALKLMKNLRSQAVKEYAAKTKLSEEEISQMMDATTWMNAEEARAKGFIDKVSNEAAKIDNSVLDEVRNYANLPEVLNQALNAAPQPPKGGGNPKPSTLIENSDMLKNLIIGLGIQGIKAESTDAEVSAAVGNHINAQASKIAELEKKLQDQRDAEIKSFLDAAQNDSQKITAEQRAHYEKIAKDGQFETVKELINGLQPRAKVTNQVIPGTNGGGADPRADWDWDKWQKEDPKGLEKMDKEDNEKFMNLYNAKYNPA